VQAQLAAPRLERGRRRGEVRDPLAADRVRVEVQHQRGLDRAAVDAVARLGLGEQARGLAEAVGVRDHRDHAEAHPQVLRDDPRDVALAAVRVDDHQLAQPRAVHRLAELVPQPHQRLRAEGQRAGEGEVLVALADRAGRQREHRRVRRGARERRVEHAGDDRRVDLERQVRAVLLDRRDRQHHHRPRRVERGELLPGQRGPASMSVGHGADPVGAPRTRRWPRIIRGADGGGQVT
jgi:hypothetical protein